MNEHDIAAWLKQANTRQIQVLTADLEDAMVPYQPPVVQIVHGGHVSTSNPPEISGNPPRHRQLRFEQHGPERIRVLKEIRKLTGLGLAEALAFIEGLPATLERGFSPEEAREHVRTLQALGATVQIETP